MAQSGFHDVESDVVFVCMEIVKPTFLESPVQVAHLLVEKTVWFQHIGNMDRILILMFDFHPRTLFLNRMLLPNTSPQSPD